MDQTWMRSFLSYSSSSKFILFSYLSVYSYILYWRLVDIFIFLLLYWRAVSTKDDKRYWSFSFFVSSWTFFKIFLFKRDWECWEWCRDKSSLFLILLMEGELFLRIEWLLFFKFELPSLSFFLFIFLEFYGSRIISCDLLIILFS